MALTESDTMASRPPTSMRLVGQGKGGKGSGGNGGNAGNAAKNGNDQERSKQPLPARTPCGLVAKCIALSCTCVCSLFLTAPTGHRATKVKNTDAYC